MEKLQPKQTLFNQLEYILVLDFEATCEQNQELLPCNQIIQFPVRVIKLPQYEWLPTQFHYYLKPTLNPKLSKFCTNLTGITQEMVDNGLLLSNVLMKFDEWIKQHKFKNFVFLTCGDWDLKTCLKKETDVKKIQRALYFRHYVNIKRIFPPPAGKDPKKWRAPGMDGMLKMLNIKLDGHHHSGIDDTWNIGKVLIELNKTKGISIKPHNITHLYQ